MTEKLFISYARKDGRELALKLQADLQAEDFEVWLDTSEIEGGASWSSAIEDAIENCTMALALLSAASYRSEICRAEQLRCIRKGKSLIPLMIQVDTERPLYLEHLNYRDFTNSADYKASFEQLLSDIREPKTTSTIGKIKETYTNAPALPLNFVERTEERDKLRQELIADDGERRIALTALQGMGGIGKSALAAWICRDEIVQAAFPDGVIWVDVGRENVNLLELIKLVGTKLGDSMGHYSSEVAALSRLRETLPAKSALIVLDDVWQSEHARAFSDIEAPRSRVLFTTRNESIGKGLGASLVKVGVMKPQQALELLREWAGRDLPEMPMIAKNLGHLPLGLKIAGGRLSEMSGKEWLDTFKNTSKLKLGRSAKTRDENLEICLDLSVLQLEEDEQLFYHALGIFPEDLWIPEISAFKLWQAYDSALSMVDCREIARDLHKLALVERRDGDGAMLLHDILHDYNRNRITERNEYKNAHQKLLNRYNPNEMQAWWEIEADGYIYENLAYHLVELERQADLHKLLTASPAWMEAKYIHCIGDSAYVADLALIMKPYKDSLSAEDLLKWVELNTARQVVNARVGTYNDDLLRALVYMGREKEALNHARLRPNVQEQFSGLFKIWTISQEKQKEMGIQLDELLQVAQSISDASQQTSALSSLAGRLAQANNPKADEVFSQAQQVAQSISDAYQQASVLSSLAGSLAQAQRFEQAQQVVQSISDASEQTSALSSLAGSLAQAQRFEQAQQVAQSISSASEQAWALSSLAGRLAQANNPKADEVFSQAQQVAQSISSASEQAWALSLLAGRLAQANNPKADEVFSQAQQAAQSISDASEQAGVLSLLAGGLAQANNPKADEVFSQAQQAAQSISDASEQAWALSSLAGSLAQAQRFEQAQQVAQSISDDYQHASALRELAGSLAQAQRFEQAHQVAQSISNDYQHASALRELAGSLAQAQRFEQAHQVVQSISDVSQQTSALSSLAGSLAQVQNPKADEVFSQAQQVAQSISDAREQTRALSSLASSLAQAQRFEQAQQVAQSISDAREQTMALSSLAGNLAQAQRFEQAQQVAQSISNDYQHASALRELAGSLAQAQRFEQAQQVAQSISDAREQTKALRELAGSLAQAQNPKADEVFSQALQVAQSISSASGQAGALSILASSLAQAQNPKADEVFSQAQQVAQSISDAYQQASVLSILASSLAQAQNPKADEVFSQALQVAQSISGAREQAWALSILAGNLAQAQNPKADEVFSQALQVVQSISDSSEQARALRELAGSLAQAQRFEQAQQIAQSVSGAREQARALRELAGSLAQAQRFEQAQQIAQSISDAREQTRALSSLAGSLTQAQRFEQAQQVAQSISDASEQARALSSLAGSLAQAQNPKADEVFGQAQQVAQSISSAFHQVGVLRELASSLAQAQLYHKSFTLFGMQTIEETVRLLATWQNSVEDLYPDEAKLWQSIILAALEIICWQRKDFVHVRDILRKP